MGLFSFLFGKKKKKETEGEALKKISTFEIVESTSKKNVVEEPKASVVVENTVDAIEEEKNGETSDKKIITKVTETKEDLESEKAVNEELKKPAPIQIGEIINNQEDKSKQKKFATKSKEKTTTPKAAPSEPVIEEKPFEEAAAQPETSNGRVGKFEIKKTKDGRYVFNLYASNHVIVATSQIYSSSQSALIGIKSIIANAERSPIEDTTLKSFEALPYPKWEIYLDKSEHYRFRLYATNGSCVVHSQGYTSKANCKKGIESIMKCAPTADIDKSYLKKPE